MMTDYLNPAFIAFSVITVATVAPVLIIGLFILWEWIKNEMKS